TKEDSSWGSWLDLKSHQWARVFFALQHLQDYRRIELKVEREGETEEIELTTQPDRQWPLYDRGFMFMPDQRRHRADSLMGALGLGMQDTYRQILQVYSTVRGMITGRISPKNLNGPITIGKVAYKIAGVDIWEFIFFLGMISINLAVVNFLPIPVLDGGHKVFLIYEKIRGRPPSEAVRVAATYVGLAMIGSLMVFGLWMDVKRAILLGRTAHTKLTRP